MTLTDVIGQKLRQAGLEISTRSVERVIAEYGLQKKLYQCRPRGQSEPEIETQHTRRYTRKKPCDPASIERGVRQLLADKVQGNLTGVWEVAPTFRILRLFVPSLWSGAPCRPAAMADNWLGAGDALVPAHVQTQLRT